MFLQVGKPLVEVNGKLRTDYQRFSLYLGLRSNSVTSRRSKEQTAPAVLERVQATSKSGITTDKSVWEYDEGTDLWNKVRDLSDEEVAANRAAKKPLETRLSPPSVSKKPRL